MERMIRRRIKELKKEVMTQIQGLREVLDRVENMLKKYGSVNRYLALSDIEIQDIIAHGQIMSERMNTLIELKVLLRDARKKKKHEEKDRKRD